jgi:hypothetical protein
MNSTIRYLRSFLKRKFSFGTVNTTTTFSDINFRGVQVRPRHGNSGIFYNLPIFGNFQQGNDIHMSIFDDSGFAKAHITFKPSKWNDLAFHYGYKFKKSKQEEFWITGDNNMYNTEEAIAHIYQELVNTYLEVIDLIHVTRTDSTGKSVTKLFNTQGTAGRVSNERQREFALREYNDQNRTPPSYLKPSGGVSKRRISQHFKKGPLF